MHLRADQRSIGLLHRASNTWTFDAIAYATVKYGDSSKTKFVTPWYDPDSSQVMKQQSFLMEQSCSHRDW